MGKIQDSKGRVPDLSDLSKFTVSDNKWEVTPVYNTDPKLIELLTDMWHNQATIIKWLSKIAENTKK